MRKNILLIALLLFTYSTSKINARDHRLKPVKTKILKHDGPVKNIPPPVVDALKAAILLFDPYLNPTFSTSSVTWSRDKNVFHVNVFHRCNETEHLSYLFTADIEANGNIVTSHYFPMECILIPPDQP